MAARIYARRVFPFCYVGWSRTKCVLASLRSFASPRASFQPMPVARGCGNRAGVSQHEWRVICVVSLLRGPTGCARKPSTLLYCPGQSQPAWCPVRFVARCLAGVPRGKGDATAKGNRSRWIAYSQPWEWVSPGLARVRALGEFGRRCADYKLSGSAAAAPRDHLPAGRHCMGLGKRLRDRWAR